MKANEAPEKIYISTNSQDGTYYISNQYKRLIEYTRTDAFIEKARKWFEEHADDYNYTWYNEMEGESGITIECIEDFINYMKGE
jgi:hypothetical protein